MAIYKTFMIFKIVTLLLYLGIIGQTIATTPINISIYNVSGLLVQSALNSLNQDSPTGHTYKSGNLISAQKLLQPSFEIYRLTLSLEPVCNEESSCPREACVIDLKQNEQGVIEVDETTAQCMYFYPQWNNDEKQLPSSERIQDIQEQEIIENLDKQIINNDTVKLDHEVQDVNDHNDKPFIAIRASHYCPGCPYELNPTLPGLEAFREAAALSMDKSDNNNYKHKVISIVRVTSVVPPGSNVVRYELLMEIGKTSCPINMLIRRSECNLSNEPIQLCLLIFDERPWLPNDRQLIKNNCTELHKIDNLNNYIKPNLISESLINGNVDIDETDVTKSEIYDQIAQEGQISTYESPIDASLDIPIPTAVTNDHDDGKQIEITEIPFTQIIQNKDNVVKEPVLTFTDKLKEFDEFLKNFDIPIKNINEKPSLDRGPEVVEEIVRPERVESKVNVEKNQPNVELSRKKRSVVGTLFESRYKRASHAQSIPGGQQVIPIDDEIRNHVKTGLKQYSATSDGDNEPQLIEIIGATRQVVSGIKLSIKVKIGESNCLKGQVAETCSLKEDNSSTKNCLITVWSRPWLNKPPEINVKCEATSSRKKRSLRGVNYTYKMRNNAQEWKDQADFKTFQKKYNKVYNSLDEETKRFQIFKKNMRTAEILQDHEQGTAEYGATKFADMTPKEFRTFTGYRSNLRLENSIPYPNAKIPDIELDPEFDWRNYNVVTPVKNQGSCGSCWAFSVTGNVEGQYAIKHKKLLSLSEQELVDCDKLDEGCNGGLQENAYRALEDLGGLELETDYPYDAEDEKCHFKKSKALVQVVSAVNITSNETQMAQWLVKNGPMAIGINANAMQFYMGGVSHPLSFLCNKKNLDHGVLIVGYGVHTYPIFKKTYPYWIIKNSWGSDWGEQGYYRVYRGDGTCGLNTDVTSAIVA